MGFVRKLFTAVFTLTYANLGGMFMSFQLIISVIKHGPRRVFSCKNRDVKPKCLENKALGTHGFLRLKNVRLHYVSAGDESKPLMLMVHGFPECWYSWRYQILEFKKDYRVVAIDQRGYGESDTPRGVSNYKIDVLVEDIREVISALGCSSCTLVAHDWGGLVAWSLAAAYPEVVKKLIVMNMPHPRCMMERMDNGDIKQLMASWYMFYFQLPFLPELTSWSGDYAFINRVFHSKESGLQNRENMTKEDIEGFKYCTAQKGNLTGMINYYRAALRYPYKIRATVTSPTLVIWGDADKALTVGLLEGTEKYVQDVTIKMVPGASHWVQQDSPQVVIKHMREFLTSD